MVEHCLILMASYNGEKYIQEQLDSICNQSVQNWRLIIRDDGSKDSTVELIKQYVEQDNRIMLIENSSNIHGAYQNFWSLIHYAKSIEKCDYYFFADQDDIWTFDKLEKMIRAASDLALEETPTLFYSDMSIIDKDGVIIYPSKNKYTGISNIKGLTPLYVHNFFPGCSVMINKALFDLAPSFPIEHPSIGIMSHDNYFAKIALVHGRVHYIDHVCIQHRIHESNATTSTVKLTLKMIINKSVFGFENLAKTHARVYAHTLLTIEQMEKNDLMTSELAEVRNAIQSGGFKGVKILLKHRVQRKQFPRTIGIYLIMLLKSYKKYLLDLLEGRQ